MLRSLEVENFRGLTKQSLTNLSRINVIVGPNAAGKTALLESIFLGARASPQAGLALWHARSQQMALPMGVPGFRAVWGGFFSGMDMSRQISIFFVDSNLGRRGIRIFPSKSDPIGTTNRKKRQQTLPQVAASLTDPSDNQSLTFERIGQGGAQNRVRTMVGPQGQLLADAANPIGPSVAIFGSSAVYNEHDNITWLSELSVANREGEALRLLQAEFPYIESLATLSISGFQGIYVSYTGAQAKLPIGLVSSGIQKILTFILASLNYTDGIILIDELENGLFYKRYGDVWSLLHELAVERDNQIFVTSHSLECLKAALSVVQKAPEDFTLIRMERKTHDTVARRFNGVEFAAALEQDVDPRGVERAL
jgi:ABC-type cobalamin/Fe3+-siderophores transport system ATPase subunit